LFNWNRRLSEQELRRAIELNPNLPQAYLCYGQFLSSQGRLDEAVTERKHVLQLDPSSQLYSQALYEMYDSSREYDKSIQQCLKVGEMYLEVSMPHDTMSGDCELAIVS
jgi:tetratricopeptide (TPR) repeat protein